MRPILVLSALLFPLAALAQAKAPLMREADGEPRKNQKIERLHSEDDGATIDELRVGGQTQDITVKPKNNAPAYQVMPNQEERSRNQGQPDSSVNDGGSRVWWNVFKF